MDAGLCGRARDCSRDIDSDNLVVRLVLLQRTTPAKCTTGQGLPAGLAEVEMIERARAKRAWEETLPTDGDKLAVRQRMMEEQEAREWKVREEEIAAIQSQRFELMKKLLVERETRIASRQG